MSNLPKDQIQPITLEHALNLHGLIEMPEWMKGLEDFFLVGTAKLIARNGEAWIREHRVRLVEELEIIAEF